MGEARRQRILDIIERTLQNSGGAIDPPALAAAIDGGLDAAPDAAAGVATPKGVYIRADEGKTPDELDASNDD